VEPCGHGSWRDDDVTRFEPEWADDAHGSRADFEDLYPPDVLAAIEAGAHAADDEPVLRLSRWSKTTAIGAVLTGMALGLQEVFDPEEERSIVVEVDDDGMPFNLPVQMILDPDSPRGSLCIVHRNHVPPPVV
jgi:hypothetical protein